MIVHGLKPHGGGEEVKKYVSHDGYPRGLGSKVADALCSNNPRENLLLLLVGDDMHNFDMKGGGYEYEVCLDECVVIVEEEGSKKELTYEEFRVWCQEN